MEKIIAASRNSHKIREMNAITKAMGITVISRDEAGVPPIEIVEDGQTFEENSYKKASVISRMTGCAAIADDSGLMVDCLDGAPGVYSARFAGEDCDDSRNNEKLLRMMEGVPYSKRTARFVSVITVVFADGSSVSSRGECRGHILTELHGENGFGYDPLFVPEGYDQTFAEISADEKNRISHRAKALAGLRDLLENREATHE